MDLATVHRLFWQSQCPDSTISVRSEGTSQHGGETRLNLQSRSLIQLIW